METVTIRSFDNYFSANILLTRLRDSGIECYLKDEYTITIDPLLSNALGGIKLIVKKAQLNEALDMLRSFETQKILQIKCPSCGGNDFAQVPARNAKNYVEGLLSWLFARPVESSDLIFKCNNCGFETEKLPEGDF